MVIEKTIVGQRVYYVDNDNDLLFTKSNLKEARQRYKENLAKKISASK